MNINKFFGIKDFLDGVSSYPTQLVKSRGIISYDQKWVNHPKIYYKPISLGNKDMVLCDGYRDRFIAYCLNTHGFYACFLSFLELPLLIDQPLTTLSLIVGDSFWPDRLVTSLETARYGNFEQANDELIYVSEMADSIELDEVEHRCLRFTSYLDANNNRIYTQRLLGIKNDGECAVDVVGAGNVTVSNAVFAAAFVDDLGNESNAQDDDGTLVTTVNQKIRIGLPYGTNGKEPGVVTIRLYVKLNTQTEFYKVADLTIDDTIDPPSNSSIAYAYYNQTFAQDITTIAEFSKNTVPHWGYHLAFHEERMWYSKGLSDTLQISRIGNPGQIEDEVVVRLGTGPISGILSHQGRLYIFKRNRVIYMVGSYPDIEFVDLSDEHGCISINGGKGYCIANDFIAFTDGIKLFVTDGTSVIGVSDNVKLTIDEKVRLTHNPYINCIYIGHELVYTYKDQQWYHLPYYNDPSTETIQLKGQFQNLTVKDHPTTIIRCNEDIGDSGWFYMTKFPYDNEFVVQYDNYYYWETGKIDFGEKYKLKHIINLMIMGENLSKVSEFGYIDHTGKKFSKVLTDDIRNLFRISRRLPWIKFYMKTITTSAITIHGLYIDYEKVGRR